MLWMIPYFFTAARYSSLIYWLPLSEWMIQPFISRIWFVCVFKSMTAERSSHIIFNSYPQRHQIKLVFFVDLHHFICKCLILPGGVFMAEMIVKCLSCNLKSLAVKTDPSCDPTVISLLGIELNFSHFLTCRDMGNILYLRNFSTLTRFIMLSFILSFWNL